MARWVFINAVGGVVISAITLIAAIYLTFSLLRQGRGKLRVRLLLGMVVSDLLLGLVAIVPEAMYLGGHGLKTGSRGCDAGGFLITVVLWTQHLWTLAIAVVTYLLLKHPLSRATYLLEKYSWTMGPFIWTVSLIHSGIWWKTVGWQSVGHLCYYGSAPISDRVDGSTLVQFIPRAIVFACIMILYSTLFSFLRRPDTIQLSSQFVSGGTLPDENRANVGARVFRRFGVGGGSSTPKPAKPVDPAAPWEQLEFVQVGGKTWELSPVSSAQQPVYHPQADTSQSILVNSRPASVILSQYVPTVSPLAATGGSSASGSAGRDSVGSSDGTSTALLSSQRPSEAETLVTSELKYDSEASKEKQALSPVLSSLSKSEDPLEFKEDNGLPGQRRGSEHALRDFFQENQAVGLDELGTGTTNGEGTKGGVQMSATAYFNRQASLLMLYFPLAYMLVFSMSLVRLVYGMVHVKPNPVLSMVSNWMVLSVGLIDGLVYGLAEFLVRRRVRRKMPDRM